MQICTLVLGDLETNCYIVWDATSKALVIDPAADLERISAVLHQKNLDVVAIVLTHAHFDHMLAAQLLSETTKAPLFVGRGDAEAMTDPIRNLSGWFDSGCPVSVDAFTCISEGDCIAVGDMSFEVLETPGHTPGCICLYCKDYLFAGDTLFEDSIGRLDFPGGDPEAMVSSLHRLMQLPPETQVFSGHGNSTTIGREVQYNPYLQ